MIRRSTSHARFGETLNRRRPEALQKKRYGKVDPAWEALMDEQAKGNTVMVEYKETSERGSLARSLGRRASHRGFKVDISDGDGYIGVRKTDESEPANVRKTRSTK